MTLGGLADDLAAASLVMARRFAAGGTMWCVSPAWPAHGRHVAVEFVHPVVVGKRALPSVFVDTEDVVADLRVLVRPGDVVLAIATADETGVAAAMRRGPAWGATTVWFGAGPRPDAGAADHVLWVEDDSGLAPWSGRFVLLYHLLWELTHVCFEHPGLLRADAIDRDCGDDICITCSDEGRLAEVCAAPQRGETQVRTAAGVETADVSLVEPVGPGDLVLVHAGSAITRVPG
ncbi:MAG: hydrogenase assembly protein HupF [Actinobacteria bacterium]|nr:hydrogenase assembly protein HupF [Actinomycetota bacterium]MBV9935480.1 hydrogenase assembly protein HupF [Actinomycetota bacterium]